MGVDELMSYLHRQIDKFPQPFTQRRDVTRTRIAQDAKRQEDAIRERFYFGKLAVDRLRYPDHQ